MRNMRKKSLVSCFFVIFCSLFLPACFKLGEIKNKDLYALTDKYVESLNTVYKSYGLSAQPELTLDGKYQVCPVGRLVVVKIMSVVDHTVYETLRDELANYYKKDERVREVYINQGGTVVVDCRKQE